MAGALQGKLGLTYTGNDYEDWGGLGEKWLQGRDGTWYYIRPDGELFRWSGGDATNVMANSRHVASLDKSYHADLLKLVNSVVAASVSETALELKRQHGFRFSGDDYEDYLGLGERWLQTRDGGWAYITPDGEVYLWNQSASDQAPIGEFTVAIHLTRRC